jgi:hypothetical protein
MEIDKHTAASKKDKYIKNGSKIVLILMILNIIGQLANTYKTHYVLQSPLIPESMIWEVNKQFVFQAIFFGFVALIGLVLYFFNKYVYIIILFVLALIVSRYIYI